jgi:hypothetical protein
MCPHTLKKKSNPFVETFRTKQSRKSSYIIPEGPPKERHGGRIKVKINAFRSKVTYVLGSKSSTKGRRSTLTNG